MIIRSLCYGYFGSVLAGLAVSVPAAVLGLAQDTIVAVAAPTGIVVGLLGLSIPMARPAMAQIRARR